MFDVPLRVLPDVCCPAGSLVCSSLSSQAGMYESSIWATGVERAQEILDIQAGGGSSVIGSYRQV